METDTTSPPGQTPHPTWWHGATLDADVSVATTLQLANPHGDIVASIPNTTNADSGNVSGATVFAPFGERQSGGGGSSVYGWEGTAQRDQINFGNFFTMGARIYNQTTGRFLTIDPVPGGNANPYMYPADPVNGKDLDGEWGWIGRAVSYVERAIKPVVKWVSRYVPKPIRDVVKRIYRGGGPKQAPARGRTVGNRIAANDHSFQKHAAEWGATSRSDYAGKIAGFIRSNRNSEMTRSDGSRAWTDGTRIVISERKNGGSAYKSRNAELYLVRKGFSKNRHM